MKKLILLTIVFLFVGCSFQHKIREAPLPEDLDTWEMTREYYHVDQQGSYILLERRNSDRKIESIEVRVTQKEYDLLTKDKKTLKEVFGSKAEK